MKAFFKIRFFKKIKKWIYKNQLIRSLRKIEVLDSQTPNVNKQREHI